MIKDGWILQNDADVEISPEQEAQIALKIQLHRDTHPRLSSFFSWKVSGERRMTTSILSSAIGTDEASLGFLSRLPGLCAVAGGRALVLALTVCPAVVALPVAGKGVFIMLNCYIFNKLTIKSHTWLDSPPLFFLGGRYIINIFFGLILQVSPD